MKISQPLIGRSEHRFWNKQNIALFTASGALSAADFTMTRANLEDGGRELNPVVRIWGRSTPGLALNFIGETSGGITLSYFFHRTGHHKLERAVSWFNISTSAGSGELRAESPLDRLESEKKAAPGGAAL